MSQINSAVRKYCSVLMKEQVNPSGWKVKHLQELKANLVATQQHLFHPEHCESSQTDTA